MTATFLIAVSNGLAKLPKDDDMMLDRETVDLIHENLFDLFDSSKTCHYCTRPATEQYEELPLCIGHYYAVDRANE
jgi:hypothetical protein